MLSYKIFLRLIFVTNSIDKIIISALLTTIFSLSIVAQTETGKIAGKVTDSSGATIAGAMITIKLLETNAERQTTTNQLGVFSITNLLPGTYEIEVEAAGFQTKIIKTQLNVGSRSNIDIVLEVGQANILVESNSNDGVHVETQSSELSTLIDQKQINELPTITRNPYDLVSLSGNIAPLSVFIGEGEGDNTGTGVGVAINGQRSSSINVLLDGVDNNNNFNGLVGQNVPLDSVQEFRVITNNFSAEYGRASGGIINVVTKNGGNELHGTVYQFNRISALASNGFDNNAQSIKKGTFTRNQFGYSVGGSVIKDKLFFFNSTEGILVRSSQATIFEVPTPQLLALSNLATQAFFNKFPLEIPINGTVTTRSEIRRLNPNGPFARLPSNLPVFGQEIINVSTNAGGGNPQNAYESVSRLDWNISNTTILYLRYALESQDLFTGTAVASPYKGFNTGSNNFNNNILLSLTHVFSPTLTTQSKIVFNRLRNDQPLGKNLVSPTLEAPFSVAGFPLTFPGYMTDLFGGPQNLVQGYQDNNYFFSTHELRFGGSILYMQDNRVSGIFQNAQGLLSTNTLGNALDNFVLGKLESFTVAVDPQGKFPGDRIQLPVSAPNFAHSNRFKDFALYINDSWHIHPRITLNLGVRYEYFGVQHNKNKRLDSNFYLGNGSTIFEQIRNGKVQIAPDSAVGGLQNPDKNNFAPRIGLAWDIFGDGTTSLRAGYGIGYERNFGSATFNTLFNPPNYAIVALMSGVDLSSIPIMTNNSGILSGIGTKQLPPTALTYINKNLRTAYANFWSMSIEHKLLQNTKISFDYSGSHGVRLYSIEDINRVGSGAVYLGDRNPLSRLNKQYSNIQTVENNGFSFYNSLTIGVESGNLAKLGLQLTAKYTWSHSIDNLSSSMNTSVNTLNLGLLDPFNPRLDKGNSDFNVKHRFVTSGIWDIPFATKTKGIMNKLFDGYSVSYIFTATTGQPFTIYDSTNSLNIFPRLMLAEPIKVTGSNNPLPTETPNLFRYIDLSNQIVGAGAYINPITNTSDFGPYPSNLTGRNAFRGPGQWNLDLVIAKKITIKDKFSVQLRMEMYNAFNHANLFILGNQTDIGSQDFIPAKRDGRRQIQMGVKLVF